MPADFKPKRTAQLNFRIADDLSRELDSAAVEEERGRADLARLIFEWGFAQYREIGSYMDLKDLKVISSADFAKRAKRGTGER